MKRTTTSRGVTVSYDQAGSGPPLVLVHGAFSNHRSNWEFVRPDLERCFTVYAVARRGRGETDATEGHGLDDEATDISEVILSVGEPVFLLGHSYGALAALAAVVKVPDHVRRLVLYEPPGPQTFRRGAVAQLETLAQSGDWDCFALTFFRDTLFVPVDELAALRASTLWPPIVADSRASLGDLRALLAYELEASRFRTIRLPVMLQVGSESLRDLYATDTLAAVLADCRIEELPGQAHEGMTTAPEMYTGTVTRFLLGSSVQFTKPQ